MTFQDRSIVFIDGEHRFDQRFSRYLAALILSVASALILVTGPLVSTAWADDDADLWGDQAPTSPTGAGDDATAPPVSEEPVARMWAIQEAGDRWRQPAPAKVFEEFRLGSIDFWIKYDPLWSSMEDRGTIVAYSNGYDTVFEVAVSVDGSGIIIANGKRDGIGGVTEQKNFVPIDLTDEKEHHIALITQGESTTVFVNGKKTGTASVGYAIAEGPAGPKRNLQLSIGSFDGYTRRFQGHIGALRIWGAPLPADALFEAAALDDRELRNLPWTRTFLIAYLENIKNKETKPQLHFLPPLFQPVGIWMTPDQATRKQIGTSASLEDTESWAYNPQTYTQLVLVAPDSALARYAASAPSHSDAGHNNRRVAGTVSIVNKWKKTYLDTNGNRLANGKAGGTAWQIEETSKENFVRLKSLTTGGYLNIESGRLQAGPIKPGWWSAMWIIEPVDNEFVRLKNRWKQDHYIHVETGKPEAGKVKPGWWSAMWKLSETTQQVATNQQPYDSAPPVQASSDDIALPVLVSLTFHPFQSVSRPDRVSASIFKPVDRNLYRSDTGETIRLTSKVYLQLGNTTLQRFDKPARPPKEGEPRIDDVFIVGNQVRNRKSALHGWNPIYLNPFDFSKPQGGKKADIFTYSPYGYEEDARLVIPKGFKLDDLQSGTGRKRHTEVTTEHELQRELGGMVALAGSVDAVKGAVAFSANASFKNKSKTLRAGKSAYTLGQAVNRRIALLLDKANIELTEPFREAVLFAARNPTPDAAYSLVKQFGTHYAHAIVMGGRIVEMVELDQETWGAAQHYEGGVGGAVEARIGLPDAGNAKAKFEAQMSAAHYESFNSSVTNVNEHWVYSGGSGGGGAGFWQVADDTMAPIFLDLRPLGEILAPPFFLEPDVFARLRPLVNQAMQRYIASNAQDIDTNERFVPKRIARYTPPVDKKDCPYDRWTLRGAINTDSKNEGGGVWVQFEFPVTEHNQVRRWEDGCYANKHWDGPLDAALECNRVCWSNVIYRCDDGKWKKINGEISTSKLACLSSGNTSQKHLNVGTGAAPWTPQSGDPNWICEMMPPGPGRPAQCN